MEDFMGYPGERVASTSRLRNGVDPIELGQNAVHYLTIDVGQSKVAAVGVDPSLIFWLQQVARHLLFDEQVVGEISVE